MASVPTGIGWSERTNMQVQKMEATIEQDLSKAMAGIREQFRQQFDSERSPAQVGDADTLSQATPETELLSPDKSAEALGTQSAHFRSEADAARDEVLGGLARLRQDLEAERARQSSNSRGAVVEREWHQLQVAATEAALTDVRQELMQQQSAVLEMRELFREQQEQYHTHMVSIDNFLVQLQKEMALIKKTSEQAEQTAGAGNSDEVAFSPGAGLVSEQALSIDQMKQDINILSSRCDQIQNFSQSVADAAAAKLDQLENRMPANSGEGAQVSPEGASSDGLRDMVRELIAEQNSSTEKIHEDMEDIRRHFAQSLDEFRDHAANQFDMLRCQLADTEAGTGAGSQDIATLAQAMELERTTRISDVAEMRAAVQEIQMCAPTPAELGSNTAEMKEALNAIRAELLEEVGAQISSIGGAFRGHVAVGCAELRGEITARLDAYETELQQAKLNSKPGVQTRLQRLETELQDVKHELQEVLRVSGMLAKGFEKMSVEISHMRVSHQAITAEDYTNALQTLKQVDTTPRVEDPSPHVVSLLSGDLKESLERLVERVSSKIKPDFDDIDALMQAPSDFDRESLPPGPPLLSHASDVPSASGTTPAVPPRAAVNTVIGATRATPDHGSAQLQAPSANTITTTHVAGGSQTVRRMLSKSQSANADDVLREKVTEALAQQQEAKRTPPPKFENSFYATVPGMGYLPGGNSSPRPRGFGTPWHGQVAGGLQQAAAPLPNTFLAGAGTVPTPSSYAMSSQPQPQPSRYMPSAGNAPITLVAQEQRISMPFAATTSSQKTQRTLSPIPTTRTVHQRPVSPLVYRQGSVARTSSPLRTTTA